MTKGFKMSDIAFMPAAIKATTKDYKHGISRCKTHSYLSQKSFFPISVMSELLISDLTRRFSIH